MLAKIRYATQVADFIGTFIEETGQFIGDVNIANVGFRDYDLQDVFPHAPTPLKNKLVIYDVGEVMAGEFDVPMLPNRGRRR
jgi:hypothetical protein